MSPRKSLRASGILTLAVIAATSLVACAGGSTPPQNSTGTNNGESAAPGQASYDVIFQPATESLAVINQLYGFANDSFADAGFNVTYNPVISNAVQASQTVATGGADIGIVGSNGALAAVGNGLDIVSVATITKGSTTQITLRNDVIEWSSPR